MCNGGKQSCQKNEFYLLSEIIFFAMQHSKWKIHMAVYLITARRETLNDIIDFT